MVLVPHELIGHLQQRRVPHVDLALPRGGHLVMVRLNDDADLAHLVDHLPAEIVVGVGRTNRKVPALEAGFVAEVWLFDARRVPRAFDRIDLVVPLVLVLLVAHLVEDEKLGLRSDVAGIGDARLAQMRFGLARDMTRVAREVLTRHGIDDIGDDADRGPGKERIEAGRVGVRDRHHVRLVNALPSANRRPVEAQPLLERPLVPGLDRKGAMLPRSEHVDELQIDHLGFVFLGKSEEVSGLHVRSFGEMTIFSGERVRVSRQQSPNSSAGNKVRIKKEELERN